MGSKYLIDNELNRYKHFKPILSDLMFPFANLYFSLIKKNIDKSLEFSKIRINGYNNKKINLIIYGEKINIIFLVFYIFMVEAFY